MDTYYFVTVNYNNSEHTEKYINSILALDFYDAESVKIIVVDNKSDTTDVRELEVICAGLPGVQLVKNEENLGYFPALNKGIDLMGVEEDVDSRYAIVGNNDMVFRRDFLKELRKVSFDDKTFVLSPRIIACDGYCQNPYHINRIGRLKRLAYKVYYSNYYFAKLMTLIASNYRVKKEKGNFRMKYDKQMEIYMGHGSCYVLTNNFFKHFSFLDDRVFLWGEEALLTGQIKSKNGIILFTPSLSITHNRSSSTNRLPSKEKYEIMRRSYRIYSRYL